MRGRFSALVVAAIGALAGCAGASYAVPSYAPLARIARATPQPLIFVGLSVNGQPGIAEFRRSANGNEKPVRAKAFSDSVVSLFGVDSSNDFWVLFHKPHTNDPPVLYLEHLSPTFEVLGTVNGDLSASATVDSKGNVYAVINDESIVEWAAGSYGKKIRRKIEFSGCCVESMPQVAVDASGNLYFSGYPNRDNTSQFAIAEWAPKVSGYAAPSETIPTGSVSPSEMLADAAGDLYLAFGTQYAPADGVWSWPAGSTTPQWLLAGLPLKAFALDSSGRIYCEVPTIENNFAIEVFSLAGQMLADIAGPKTRLGYPSAIAVTP